VKVVVAPDKFAGTLSAAEAALAIAAGWRRIRPADEVLLAPMADGGEGTLAVLEAALAGAERIEVEVADALGRPVPAAWLRLPDGRALVEVAQACGLSRLAPEERDPLRTTSYGVGQLLRAAAAAGAVEVIVGLGGSGTVDGGAGMAVALGHRLLRGDGNGIKVGGAHLGEVDRVVPGPDLGVPFHVAVDVTSPLLGPDGAVAVFGPQKGADAQGVRALERGLASFAGIAERDLPGGPWRDVPGAGAAGGLGFALMAFCGGVIAPGAALVAELIDLEATLRGADVVITGEGALDAQTAASKAPVYILERARANGALALAVAGRVQDGAGGRFDAVAELGPEGTERPSELVQERAAVLAAAVPM